MLELLDHGKVIKTYRVALGGDLVGPKTRQGDHRTPEGVYVLDSRNAYSRFYKSIHISYPNAQDRAAARKSGFSPGGDVFVHGLPNGCRFIGAARAISVLTSSGFEETISATSFARPIERRSSPCSILKISIYATGCLKTVFIFDGAVFLGSER